MVVTEERILTNTVPERLASLSEYPSGKYLYHDWKHNSYKADAIHDNAKPKEATSRAFIRNADNGNNV